MPTVFVRLTGCPLRCGYCDTAYAFSGGEVMTMADILQQVQDYGVQPVTVTGGEPLAQPGCLDLLRALCDNGHRVSLETSGALDVMDVDPRVVKVVDVKTPGSSELAKNRWQNLAYCTANDQVKFVLCDRRDYDWARLKCDEHDLYTRVGEVLFSPSSNELSASQLADWIIADRLPVRLQVQLHKLLWGDQPGR
jgi:7-carboxy-7-deazaguanine synthase